MRVQIDLYQEVLRNTLALHRNGGVALWREAIKTRSR